MISSKIMSLNTQALTLNLIRSYWQDADQNWHYPSYQRPYNWLIHTLSGRGYVQLDDHKIELVPNTLALLPLNQACHYRCVEPMRIGACAFTLELPSGIDVFQLYRAPTQPKSFSDTNPITEIIEAATSSGGYFSAISGLYKLLSPIIEDSQVIDSMDNNYQRLAVIFNHIDKHLTNPISVPELAQLHGTSTAHFSRWFSATAQVSPKKYINQKRVEQACKRLLLTTEKIEHIAFSCGFEDPLYFSKSFKKITGLTPRDYRKTQKYDLF